AKIWVGIVPQIFALVSARITHKQVSAAHGNHQGVGGGIGGIGEGEIVVGAEISRRSEHRDGSLLCCLKNLMSLYDLGIVAASVDGAFGRAPTQRDDITQVVVHGVLHCV